MKSFKISLAAIALVLGVAFSAFTTKHSNTTKSADEFWYTYDAVNHKIVTLIDGTTVSKARAEEVTGCSGTDADCARAFETAQTVGTNPTGFDDQLSQN